MKFLKHPWVSRDLREWTRFLTAILAVFVVAMVPDIAAAASGAASSGGGFLHDTSAFEGDVRKTWTLVSYVAIFGGLVVMVMGMFLPIASWMKWGAIGAVLVGAFGESIVTYLYSVGGNAGATQLITP